MVSSTVGPKHTCCRILIYAFSSNRTHSYLQTRLKLLALLRPFPPSRLGGIHEDIRDGLRLQPYATSPLDFTAALP